MKDINPAIEDMIAQKKLSETKIAKLVFIKKLIDRVASKPYLPESEVEKIERKFGVKPDVITWGDYFQTNLATDHWEKSDDDFEMIINTVRFDLIASVMIFSNKSNKFFSDVENAFQQIHSTTEEGEAFQDEEIDHLHILMTYFNEMGLKIAGFETADFDFFREFAEVKAVS